MQKLIALIFISATMLQAMEDHPGEENPNLHNIEQEIADSFCDYAIIPNFKEYPELDTNLQDKLLIEEAIKQSIEIEEQRVLNKVIEISRIATWQMLPEEVKLHIFSFIPFAMKHLMLTDNESKALTDDRIFLQALAHKLVKENLKKAVEKFGHAIETENKMLTKAFLKVGIMEMITRKEGFEAASIGSFAQAVIRSHKKIANKIFVKAAQKNNVTLIQAFLNGSIDIDNAYNELGNNALMEAAAQGNQEAAQLLLDHHANVNAQNKFGCSPLYFAACNGQAIIVQLLISHETTNIEINTITGTTPLIIAAKLGYEAIVELLIDHRANVNAEESTRHTALIYACRYGHLGIAKLLLAHHADARIKTKEPQKWYSMPSWVTTLLDTKTQKQPSTVCYGYTALMYACEEGHEMIAEELLDHCDINAKNEARFTALQCVITKYAKDPNMHDKLKKIIDLLIRNGGHV